MKQITIFAALLVFCSNLFAQNSMETILNEIEKNNTTLSAIRKSTDAEKIGNKTGIYLQNPEAAFNYLWGNPSGTGNRTDFSLKQTIDFPTAYGYKKQITDLRNEQAELEYQKQRKAILLRTRLVCADLVYTNALKMELSKRVAHVVQIANSYKAKFDVGEVNILEYNKAQLNLLNLNKEIEVTEIEQTVLLAELTILNGGIPIEFTYGNFPIQPIAPDFDKWYTIAEQGNPVLQWLKQEIAISQKDEKLQSAMGLPKIGAGYMSEKVVGEQFQGVTIGLSIPLWENKNTVKYAKAKTIAMQSIEADAKLQFYNQMKSLHSKAVSLQNSVADYRRSLQSFSNSDLLQKALDKGEISLAEYLFELSVYYDSTNKLLEMERNRNKSLAELNNLE